MDHLEYEVEDFLCDVSFQQYCLGTDDGAIVYWQNWIKVHPEKTTRFENARKLYFELNGNTTARHFNADYTSFKEAFSRKLRRLEGGNPVTWRIKRMNWPRIVVAASITVIFSMGIYYYSSVQFSLGKRGNLILNDVPPGKNSATLTLSNGRKILLSGAVKGHIADESGVSISRTADEEIIYTVKDAGGHGVPDMNTLSTANGQQYQVRLPDSTRVWLNAASSLKYPVSFASLKERKVELSGEGYFEVSKDKAHPFIVKTAKQEVKVLGTHFNINSYADENEVKTTLLEGSVQVMPFSAAAFKTQAPIILKPGERSGLTATDIQVSLADIETELAWKNGDFIFNNEDLESIMRKVGKWYNVQFMYNKKTFQNLRIWGKVSRSKNISSVLEALELTGKVKFKVEGRRITVIE